MVRTSGGKNDKMDYIPVDSMVKFKHGEKVVLFLTDDIDARPDKDDFDYFVVVITKVNLKRKMEY